MNGDPREIIAYPPPRRHWWQWWIPKRPFLLRRDAECDAEWYLDGQGNATIRNAKPDWIYRLACVYPAKFERF